MTYTIDQSGLVLTETVDGITLPADYGFSSVNDYVQRPDVTYEHLEALCLGMANYIDKLRQSNTTKNHIDALVGDRLTAQKASDIIERDGYTVTGVVMTLPGARACIVNRSAVRWLEPGDLFNLMHTDTVLKQRLIDEAVATGREVCAVVFDQIADEAEANNEPSNRVAHYREKAAALRAQGKAPYPLSES